MVCLSVKKILITYSLYSTYVMLLLGVITFDVSCSDV